MKTCYVVEDAFAVADLVAPGELTPDWTITRINVPHKYRGHGTATKLLEMILADADREHVALQLEVQASDGLTDDILRDWYQRHGFRDAENWYMRRPARSRAEWVWVHRSEYGAMLTSSDTFDDREKCVEDAALNAAKLCWSKNERCESRHYNEIERVL